MTARAYSPIDTLLIAFDQALRTTFAPAPTPSRPNPATGHAEAALSETERRHVGGLMRVNHAGEISAQALYQGQALTARLPTVRAKMEQAAIEENDHLAWTEERLHELGTHTSHLAPLWYAGSFAIGAAAGLAGDKWSLGFVVETERQVIRHLDSHLAQLPPQDEKSRAILEQMREDEAQHATTAFGAGAAELPAPVRQWMRLTSKVMTTLAYRF
jgi:ubiquinone biosynthesis monooxygenase Coq7